MRGIRPGEVIYLISATNIGKTSHTINIINYLVRKDFCVPFFSLENNEYQIFERIMQIQKGLSSFGIKRKIANKDEELMKIAETITFKPSNIIYWVSLSDIPSYIKVCEELSGLKTGLVIIDYVQLVQIPGASEYARVSDVAQQIKEISLKMRLPILLLIIVSRIEAKVEKDLQFTRQKVRAK